MNNLKQLFLLMVLALLCVGSLAAQPGNCKQGYATSTFDPLRTCNPSYISEEFVFVGRVISTDTKITQMKNHPSPVVKINIVVETLIKGKQKRNIELFLDYRCYEYIEKGEKRIFTARRIAESDFTGLVSYQWSTSLKDIPENELAKIISEVRFVAKGVKQPRIKGKVIQSDSSPLDMLGFNNYDIETNLGYNPEYSSPLNGVEVIAKRSYENANPVEQKSYKTKTNSDGNYEFKDLPVGFYEISLALPEDLCVRAFLYKTIYPGKIFGSLIEPIMGQTYVNDGVCGNDVRFNVRPAGKIKGKLIFEDGMPSDEPFLRLLWVKSETQRNRLHGAVDYSFDMYEPKTNPQNTLEFFYSDLQVGKYILKIVVDPKDEQKNFYHPGVRKIEDAEIINIKAGETKDILIRYKPSDK